MTLHPILKLVDEIQGDLARANARFQALRAHLAAEDFAPVVLPVCEHGCGPLHLPPATTLDDHYRNMHDNTVRSPLPARPVGRATNPEEAT